MVEYKTYKDGGQFWRIGNGCFIRDHPKWQEKHPLGPVTFDVMCPECTDFVIEDTPETKSDLKKMEDHILKVHVMPRLLEEMSVMWSEGQGI